MTMDDEKYPDRRNLRRINDPSYAGWQFFIERKTYQETKHFNDSKYGSTENAYKEAIKYRDEVLETAKELGILDDDRLPFNLALSPRNTSGIVGVSRRSQKREHRKTREEEWLANYKDDDGKNKQKKFTISVNGEKVALYKAIEFRKDYVKKVCSGVKASESRRLIEEHIQELEDLLSYVQELEDDSDVFFFLGTINNPLLKNTEKQDLLNIRIGQKKFRRLVLDFWGHKCVVTGSSYFLNAGHIKPWRDADNSERLDVYNGLAMSPVYDRAFDAGEISFDERGHILISSRLMKESELLGISPNASIEGLNFLHQKYLEYHRKNIFKG